jgi:hypothetical protein
VAVPPVAAGAGGEGEPTGLAAEARGTAGGLAVTVQASGAAPGAGRAGHGGVPWGSGVPLRGGAGVG